MADDISTTGEAAGAASAGAASSAPQQEAQPQAPQAFPLAAPVSPAAAPPEKNISADIAQILKDVKLPEHPQEAAPRVIENQAPALGELPRFEASAAQAAPIAEAPAPEAHEIPAAIVPPKAPTPDEAPPASELPPIVSVHTMKNDLQDVVRERKISAVRAAAIEEDSARRPEPLLPPEPRTGRLGLIIVSILVLLALGGAALYGVYVVSQGSAPQAPAQQSGLFAEHQTALPLDGQTPAALKAELGGIVAQPISQVGTITQIIPAVAATDTAQGEAPASFEQFMDALGANPPADLFRAVSDKFFFGIHMADAPAPVFILTVTSYDRAFADMLAWEPSIDADLSPLFKQVPAVEASASSSLPVERQFQDMVMQNYDVRALKDDTGSIVLYYSFPTPSLLIIAGSPYTFTEVLSRLQAERKL